MFAIVCGGVTRKDVVCRDEIGKSKKFDLRIYELWSLCSRKYAAPTVNWTCPSQSIAKNAKSRYFSLYFTREKHGLCANQQTSYYCYSALENVFAVFTNVSGACSKSMNR